MQLPYWTESLQERLKATFRYNPDSGEVTRTLMPVKGPKTVGAIGSMSGNNRDVVIVVHHEGRAWTIRVAKLALFLHTGNQYKFIDFIDGDRTNFKIENLTTKGDPLTPEANDPEATKAALEKAKVAMMAKRRTTYVDFVKNETGDIIEKKIVEQARKVEESKQERIPIIEDVLREQQAREADEWAKFCSETGLGELLSLWKEYEDRWKGYRWKHGLATGMKEYEAFRFQQDVEPILGKTCLELYLEKRSDTYTAEHEEKWFHDAFKLGGMHFMAERLGGTVEERLKKYRWQGEEVENTYEELSAEDTVEYVKRKQEIEARLGTTQEELEARWEERKKVLEEMQYARPQE